MDKKVTNPGKALDLVVFWPIATRLSRDLWSPLG